MITRFLLIHKFRQLLTSCLNHIHSSSVLRRHYVGNMSDIVFVIFLQIGIIKSSSIQMINSTLVYLIRRNYTQIQSNYKHYLSCLLRFSFITFLFIFSPNHTLILTSYKAILYTLHSMILSLLLRPFARLYSSITNDITTKELHLILYELALTKCIVMRQ